MSDIDVIVHLTDEYERSLNNAAQWRKDIERLLKTQNDNQSIQIIMDRVTNTTESYRIALSTGPPA